ncbi:hypothetical protein [Sphingomicrobium astaxanthinifaciens]|uniref:hypothetical protein n=1 Tax=Sphingomicrobium astaxanthinifaciens TaxID=1227949 RepID=UPI001FCBCBE6|nr:hypothetical protein [Sphingomicrobium astaxanthinifaciens]MCJ7422035.1 hypothetical protein [Sphingomicrobium astaxanthinifaciens]
MRKMFIGLSAALAAGMVALPAAAAAAAASAAPAASAAIGVGSAYQPYYRGGDRYDRYDRQGYDRGYDRRGHHDYRRHFAWGKVRELHNRVARMRQDIRYFARQGAFDRDDFRKLDRKAERLHYRIDRMSRHGLNRGEYRAAVRGIRNLRREIRHELRDGRRWENHGYGYRGDRDRYWHDDDRWERDSRWDRRGDDRDDDRRYERRRDWDDRDDD